jgi:ATP-binding cassette subfamily C (CFTR/MRP) protein 1
VFISAYLTPAITFGIFIATSHGQGLSISTVFTSLSLISLLGTPLSAMFAAVPQLSMTLACFKRIQEFLVAEERTFTSSAVLSGTNITPTPGLESGSEIQLDEMPSQEVLHGIEIIGAKDIAFGNKEGCPHIVQHLNFRIYASSLTMIIGKVGSGKSTLLRGLIGELDPVVGSIRRKFSTSAYCSQETWLFNDTIQNNILGQSTLQAGWYETVVTACALDKDFASLPLGGLTVVGSKGISLSGGQKSRVVSVWILYMLQIIDFLVLGAGHLFEGTGRGHR